MESTSSRSLPSLQFASLHMSRLVQWWGEAGKGRGSLRVRIQWCNRCGGVRVGRDVIRVKNDDGAVRFGRQSYVCSSFLFAYKSVY